MSDNSNVRAADDQYEDQNDTTGEVMGDVQDNDYVSRTGQSHIPVQKDSAAIEDPSSGGLDPNSDAQLERDETDAINKDNIIDERTRGAKPTGSLSEGPDEDDLPAEALQSGKSAVAQ